MPITIKVRKATDKDSESWDKFVKDNSGSFYQRYEWRFVYEEQGVKTFYLIAHDGKGNIAGIFSFVKIPMFLNNSIHSMPRGGAYGGPLSKSTEVITALMERMNEICIKESVAYASILINPHIDNSELIKCFRSIGYSPRYTTEKSPNTFVLSALDYKITWKLFDRMVRKAARKATREGVSIIKNDWSFIRKYYSIMIKNRRRIKVGVIEEKIFYRILRLFQDYIEFYIAVYKGKPIAGAYCVDFQNIRYLIGNVSIPEYMKYRPNNLLYNEMIKDGCEKPDIDIIDFGSTAPKSSYFRWKKQYGGTPAPLQYYEKTYSPVKKFIREKTVRPRVIIRRLIWSKLVSQEHVNKMSHKMRKFLEWF